MSDQCPLYPQKRTWFSTIVMSALCQKRTFRRPTRLPDRRAAARKVEQTAQAVLWRPCDARVRPAVSMAPPAPPAITCETIPPILRLPDCAAATTDGGDNVTIRP